MTSRRRVRGKGVLESQEVHRTSRSGKCDVVPAKADDVTPAPIQGSTSVPFRVRQRYKILITKSMSRLTL